jgi:hypothetical protein
MILFDWRCAVHGDFEGSHAICPHLGCDSGQVTKIFLKAPGSRSDKTRRFDAGIRKSAESMGLSNFRSARAGEAAHGGDIGKQVLWGNEVQKAMPGTSFAQLSQQAEAGSVFKKADGTVEKVPSGMRLAAQAGITQRPVPKAERTVARADAAASAA